MTLASGTKLGPYQIVSPLGAGGMGAGGMGGGMPDLSGMDPKQLEKMAKQMGGGMPPGMGGMGGMGGMPGMM